MLLYVTGVGKKAGSASPATTTAALASPLDTIIRTVLTVGAGCGVDSTSHGAVGVPSPHASI